MSISPSKPLPPPSWCTVRLKEAEQKYQCAICENKKKHPKVVQFLFKFLFISSFYYYDNYYRLSVLDAEKTKNFVWFFVERWGQKPTHMFRIQDFRKEKQSRMEGQEEEQEISQKQFWSNTKKPRVK
jgi:hypothetical protein